MGIHRYYAMQSTIYFVKLGVNVPLKRRLIPQKIPVLIGIQHGEG
jgi:hypothetical protein